MLGRVILAGAVFAVVAVLAGPQAMAEDQSMPALGAPQADQAVGEPVVFANRVRQAQASSRVGGTHLTPTSATRVGETEWVATQDPCCPDPIANPCAFPACPEWHLDLELYAFLPGITGDITIRGNNGEVDSTPADTIDNVDKLDGYFAGQLGIQYGQWRLNLSGFYTKIGDQIEIDESTAGATMEATMFYGSATLGYIISRDTLSDCCPPGPCPACVQYEVYAGARFYSVDGDFTGPAGGTTSGTEDWIDPIFGGKITFDFDRHWSLVFQGDVGGFGVNSDFAWLGKAQVNYRFGRNFWLLLGFGALGIDYKTGSGATRFVWDLVNYGPYVGFGVGF
ncbi:MAG: hypothetical protein ACYTG6_11695 [Planctomycetota bacterium]|jgi:hypothetical protein